MVPPEIVKGNRAGDRPALPLSRMLDLPTALRTPALVGQPAFVILVYLALRALSDARGRCGYDAHAIMSFLLPHETFAKATAVERAIDALAEHGLVRRATKSSGAPVFRLTDPRYHEQAHLGWQHRNGVRSHADHHDHRDGGRRSVLASRRQL